MGDYGFVAEDLEWFRDEWWGRRTELLSDGHIRRASFTLGCLLLDGAIQRAWRALGFAGEPRLPGPDLAALAARDGLRLDLAAAVVAGGGREDGSEVAFIGAFRIDNPTTGVPAGAPEGFAVEETAIVRPEGLVQEPGSLGPDIEGLRPLSEYLDGIAVVRRGLIITRRQLIEFFRAHPAGVVRVPPDDGHQMPQSVERGISELMGRVHVDRRDGLYFELLSIGQAVGRSVDLQSLASAIRTAEHTERRATPPTKDHAGPGQEGGYRLFLRMARVAGDPDPDGDFAERVVGLRSLDTVIYRTTRWRYTRNLLKSGSVSLVAPSLWEDPFERLVCNANLYSADKKDAPPRPLITLRRIVYAQCWSLNAESDAIWRIYSTVSKDSGTGRNRAIDDEGIRIRTTVRRLLRAVWDACPPELRDGLFFGRVRYMHAREALQAVADELVRSLQRKEAPDRHALATAESLLIKRDSFAHEDECRLIFVDTRDSSLQHRLFELAIADLNVVCNHLTLDPRLCPEDVQDRTQEVRRLGFTGEVVQSSLYAPIRIDLQRGSINPGN